jgi:uncharacterized membrane protein YkoI
MGALDSDCPVWCERVHEMESNARMSGLIRGVIVRRIQLGFAATLFAGCSSDGGSSSGVAEPQSAVSAAQVAPGPVSLQEDRAGLLAQVKVSEANARLIAMQRVPGGRIVEAELEEEGGRLLYSYEIRAANGRDVVEVQIDARTGAVVSEARESTDDDEDGPSDREDDDPRR